MAKHCRMSQRVVAVWGVVLGGWAVMLLLAGGAAAAEEAQVAKEGQAAEATQEIVFGEGVFQLVAPAEWRVKQPRTRIVERELMVPRVDGDAADGRLTIMGAGGTVEQNIDRWVGQFSAPAGEKVARKVTADKVAGQQVHRVDLAGTFKDQRGPFAPATERPGYRMLGAIIVTEGKGQYFVKLYGPQATIAAAEKQFHQFIDSLSIREK